MIAVTFLVLVALPHGSPSPHANTRATARVVQVQGAPTIAEVAEGISADLAKMAKEHEAFFDDPYLKIGGRAFGVAQQAAMQLTSNGEPVFRNVMEFHNELDEFIRAIEQFPGWTPGTTGQKSELQGKQPPKDTEVKKVLAAALAVKKKANSIAGFQDLDTVAIDQNRPPEFVIEYAIATVDRIRFVLDRRGLGPITGDSSRLTNEIIGPPLADLRAALAAQLDASGERVVRLDSNGKPESDQLRDVKQSLAKLDRAIPIFKKAVPWAADRLKIACEDLRRLREVVLRQKSLREL